MKQTEFDPPRQWNHWLKRQILSCTNVAVNFAEAAQWNVEEKTDASVSWSFPTNTPESMEKKSMPMLKESHKEWGTSIGQKCQNLGGAFYLDQGLP